MSTFTARAGKLNPETEAELEAGWMYLHSRSLARYRLGYFSSTVDEIGRLFDHAIMSIAEVGCGLVFDRREVREGEWRKGFLFVLLSNPDCW